jgi:ketosteroid isomerase-like protein
MASRNEMLETIHRAYEARATGDMEGLMTAFHSQGAFELKGEQKHLQVAGLTEGHANVRAAMTGFVDTFKFVKRDIIATVVEGDRAVVHSRVAIRFIPTDTTVETDILDVFTFKDGKIIRLEEFADTAMVKHLMGG